MCGRFSQAESSRRLAQVFGAEPDDDLPAGVYNVAPTDPIRIVLEEDGRRRLRVARWGFLPFWAASEAKRPPTWINARVETAWESPAFGPALRKRRCLIPADAFFEWDRSLRPPQPYAIGPATDGQLLAFAGIWSPSRTDGDRPSAAILTTGPNRLLEALHDRMPVTLAHGQIDGWLAADAEPGDIMPLLVAAPEERLRVWPVSTAVNRVGTDGPGPPAARRSRENVRLRVDDFSVPSSADASVAADALPLKAAELADFFLGEPCRFDESEKVPVEMGFLANHVVRAHLALALGEHEAVTGNDELADRGITERLVEDVANDRRHLAGHLSEAVGTQLLDQYLAHELILSRLSERLPPERSEGGVRFVVAPLVSVA